MNTKLIVLGGLAFYVMTWVVSVVTGPLIHQGVLAQAYVETAAFWRPELMQVPPDMAALMPRWIVTGLIHSFVVAGLYGYFRPALAGTGFLRGAKFGIVLWLFAAALMGTWTGIFNLPDRIWFWWMGEFAVSMAICGGVLGWVADRWCAAAPAS